MSKPRNTLLLLHELTDIIVADGYETPPNPDHLRHVFTGYREFVINGSDVRSPFDVASVAHRSWKIGVELARNDLNVDERPDEVLDDAADAEAEPDVDVTADGTATPRTVSMVLGNHPGQFIYYGSGYEEIIERDGLRVRLASSGWKWLRHCKLLEPARST